MSNQVFTASDTAQLFDDTREAIIHGFMITSLGIGLAMIALSREPTIAINVGATMYALAACIMAGKSLIATAWLRTAAHHKSDYAEILEYRARWLRHFYIQASVTAGSIAMAGWIVAVFARLMAS